MKASTRCEVVIQATDVISHHFVIVLSAETKRKLIEDLTSAQINRSHSQLTSRVKARVVKHVTRVRGMP